MKKFFSVIAIASILFTGSCKKQDMIITAETKTDGILNVEGELINWDQLPEEYRNAPRIAIDQESGDYVSARSNNELDQTFNGFANITGSAFTIPLPPSGTVIDKIGIGHGGTYVSYLAVWYRKADGTLYAYAAGGSGGQLVSRTFTAGEYIKSISGSSGGALNSLTIRTNRTTFSAGTSNQGTFSYVATIGSYISNLRGGYSTSRINQLNVSSYFKPWVKVAGSLGRDIAMATDGTAYMTDTYGRVLMLPNGGTSWTVLQNYLSLNANNIACNANKLCITTTSGDIYLRGLLNGGWQQLPGGDARDVAIQSDGTVWMINDLGQTFYLLNNAWRRVYGATASRIAAANGQVQIIAANGLIYQIVNGLFRQLPGSSGRDIAIGSDNNSWLTNSDGEIYCLQSGSTSWKELAGSDAMRIAAIPGRAMLVNTAGLVYAMVY